MSKIVCFLIGEDTLSIRCAEIIVQTGHHLLGIKSPNAQMHEWANKHSIPCTDSLENFKKMLETQEFDYLFSIVNSDILPKQILEKPRKFAINYHDALLPQYAGICATSWAILNNEKKHGVTWHIMTESIDAGDILKQVSFSIDENETALSLDMKCLEKGVKTFTELLNELEKNIFIRTKQNLKNRHYYSGEKKPIGLGLINWTTDAKTIYRLYRALHFPNYINRLCLPKFMVSDKIFIPKKFKIIENKFSSTPGIITKITNDYIRVGTLTEDVEITEITDELGNVYKISDLVNRYNIREGYHLSSPSNKLLSALKTYNKKIAKAELFWVAELLATKTLSIPTFLPNKNPLTNNNCTMLVGKINTHNIFKKHKANFLKGVNSSTILLTSLLIYLFKINSYEQYSIFFNNKPITKKNENNLHNFFASHLPLTLNFEAEISFQNALNVVTNKISTLEKKQTYLNDVILRYPSLNSHNISLPIAINIVDSVEEYHSEGNQPLNIVITNKTRQILWYLNQGCVNASQLEFIKNMPNHTETLIKSLFIDNMETKPIHFLPILSKNERKNILYEFNNTKANYPKNKTVHELFSEQTKDTPNLIAIKHENSSLSYKELENKSNQLARYLIKLGIKPGMLVATFLERSIETIVSIIAILKTGGAYIALDINNPKEYIEYILSDSQTHLILTNTKLKEKISHVLSCNNDQKPLLLLDENLNSINQEKNLPLEPIGNSDSPAYVIYTSGSVGKPKGVIVPHKAINRLVKNTNYIHITTTDNFLQAANMSFDAATLEIWGALLNGAKLVLPNPTILLDINKFANFLEQESITALWLTAGLFNQYAALMPSMFKKLNYLLVGGDILNPEKIHAVSTCQQGRPKHILNGYGPTENTTFTTTFNIPADFPSNIPIPIGKPISNTTVYVLDKYLQLVPVGVPGELHAGGDGLASGYINQPTLNEKKFIINPFNPTEQLYKTGDLVRWLPDGNLDFIGRQDTEIKIRGFRVDTEAIVSQLSQHESVNQAAIIAIVDDKHDKYLSAYIVPSEHAKFSLEKLQNFLQNRLPHYMIPARFFLLEKLPLTPNGKVDYKKLSQTNKSQQVQLTNLIAPRTETEKKLTRIWKELLSIDNIGINDSFFSLGGSSFLVTELALNLWRDFKFELPLHDFLEIPTIVHLAQLLESNDSSRQVITTNFKFGDDLILDSKIKLPNNYTKSSRSPKAILLTGATGFLGIYLLHTLTRLTKSKIYCLVRADTLQHAKKRLINTARSYQLNINFKYVSIVLSDLSKPCLGLTNKQFNYLASKIDIIYHCGAYVHHLYSYELLRESNVSSTKELLRLAVTKKVKSIHYISTLSAGLDNYDENGLISEKFIKSETIPSSILDGYSQSKWVSEKLLSQAHDRGIPIKIYRLGWITGESKKGLFPVKNNHLFLLIKGCIQMGCAPDWTTRINMLPVDFISEIIIKISLNKKINDNIFNIVSRQTFTWHELLHWLNEHNYSIKKVEPNHWREQHLNKIDNKNVLFPLLPLYFRSKQTDWLKAQDKMSDVNNSNTSSALNLLKMHYPKIDEHLLLTYFKYLHIIGFLNKPACIHHDKGMNIDRRYFMKKKNDPDTITNASLYLSQICSNSSDIIICLDKDFKISDFNINAENYFGISEEDAIGKNYINFCNTNKIKPIISKKIKNDLIKNYKIKLENTIVKKDSIQYSYAWEIINLFTKGKDLSGAILIGKDVTWKIQLDAQSKKIDKYLQDLASCMPGNFYWKNKDGHYLGCNAALLQVLKMKSLSEIIGKTDYDLWPEQANELRRNDQEVMLHGKPIYLEETVAMPNGKKMFFAVIKVPLINEYGNIAGIIGNSLDITELKNTQAALKEAKERAEVANEAKSKFIAVVSHELRLPLTAILGVARLLSENEENLSLSQRESIEDIIKSGEHLHAVINDVLDFSKLEANKLELHVAPLDFRKLIEDTATMFAHQVKLKRLELLVNYAENAPHLIIADARALRQILINLIGNALKFTEQGHVWIKVDCTSQSKTKAVLELSIEDSGIGIPEDKLNMIFDRFSQVDSSRTRRYGGTGLGLTITKAYVEEMGGTILVKSNLEKGSIFSCTIPFQLQASAKAYSPWEPYKSKVRILVVDDTLRGEVLCRHIASSLCELSSGQDALNTIRAAQQRNIPFDIIIIDEALMNTDPFKLAYDIQQHKLQQPLLLLVTPNKSLPLRETARGAGFFDCLAKPTHPTELLISLTVAWEKWTEKNYKPRKTTLLEQPKKTQPHVLLVEDDPIVQKVHCMMLEKEDFLVDIAKNGKQALENFAKDYDAIIMDIGLPDIDGFAVATEIRHRENGTKKRIPIIAITGFSDLENLKKCKESGIDEVAIKPIKAIEIKELLNKWVKKQVQHS